MEMYHLATHCYWVIQVGLLLACKGCQWLDQAWLVLMLMLMIPSCLLMIIIPLMEKCFIIWRHSLIKCWDWGGQKEVATTTSTTSSAAAMAEAPHTYHQQLLLLLSTWCRCRSRMGVLPGWRDPRLVAAPSHPLMSILPITPGPMEGRHIPALPVQRSKAPAPWWRRGWTTVSLCWWLLAMWRWN